MTFVTLNLLGIVVIFTLLKFKFQIGNAMFLGALAVGISGGIAFLPMLNAFIIGATSPSTLNMVIVTLLAAFLGNILKETGHVNTMIIRMSQALSPLNILLVVPVIMGALLFPPGGAGVSGQVIAETFRTANRKATQKLAALNMWFRMCGRFLSPFIPSVVFAAQLSGTDSWRIVLNLLPVTIIMSVLGYYYASHKFHRNEFEKEEGNRVEAAGVEEGSVLSFGGFLPIFFTVILILFSVPFNTSLAIAIVCAFLEYWWKNEVPLRARTLWGMIDWKLGWAVVGICLFNEILNTTKSPQAFVDYLSTVSFNSALLLVFYLIIPLILSFFLGTMVGTMGIIIPLVVSLGGDNVLIMVTVAYASANLGCYMLSPLNADFVVAQRSLPCALSQLYSLLVGPVLITIGLLGIYGFGTK